MPVYKRPDSTFWQIKFKLAGRTVRRSANTTDKRAAEELEERLRAEVWRQIRLGEHRFSWEDAVEKCRDEDAHLRSWDRTERSIKILNEYLSGAFLDEIDYDALLKVRKLLTKREGRGHNNKTAKVWKPSTVNRVMAVARSILRRCQDPWKMINAAPKVPLYRLEKVDPPWITREQAHGLLGRFPQHTRDMMIFALATGLRRSNVTQLEWSRVDMTRATAHIPGNKAKGKTAIPVPLNADALAVLSRWKRRHEEMGEKWSPTAHRYVFVFRSRAPIKQVTTKMWRRVCKECGLEGVTFHTMRHTWASWQVQAETPLKMLQELGGWATLEMPLRYAHLSPGHLAQYADRTLLGTESGTVDCSEGETAPK